MEKKILTQKDYSNLLTHLCILLEKQNITAVFGVPRGGLPIAVYVSHHLNIPMVISFEQFISEYGIKNTKLLVIDDIVDTGISLLQLCSVLKTFNINFLTASLHYKSLRSTYKPNFFVKETDDWIVYPWETDNIFNSANDFHKKQYDEFFKGENI